MTKPTLFGTHAGADVLEVTLRSDAGAEAKIISFGAVLRDLHVPSKAGPQRVVLGFEKLEDYPAHSPHFGANPGRVANRIGHGRFTLDGVTYEVDKNQAGKHLLHGGKAGFGMRVWTLAEHDRRSATFVLISDDGDMGFPGRVVTTCTYRLLEPATLHVSFTATTDKATPINLAHHSYFNLDDGGLSSTRSHRLMLNALAYLPVDDELIPTGVVQPVEGTPFDFRQARPIEAGGAAYDHNFCLAAARGALHQGAWAQGAQSGVEMEVWTTEPGIQFYDGERAGRDVPGLEGRRYPAHAGFCLEAQVWPDAPNRPYFPQAVLWPGAIYRQTTEYRFRLP